MGHIIDPFGIAIIEMLRLQWADVVRLAVVIPGNNLNHGEALLQDLLPSVIDQSTTWEDPVLGI